MPSRGDGSAPSQRNLRRAPLTYKAIENAQEKRVNM
jgi:hypothetical protein